MKPPRLLLIGAGGFLGAWLSRLARDKFHVIEGLRQPAAAAAETVCVDITDSDSVQAAFDIAQPDVVILTAAISDIDRCEREPELAESVNAVGPKYVARACAAAGARLLFTSTGAVFDGTRPGYAEDAQPTPLHQYGRTKVRAEARIAELLPSAAIIRFSLALGLAAREGTNSYVNKLRDALQAGRTVEAPTFEYRNPIDAVTLASELLKLATLRDATGIFHVGASDKMSRYELAQRLAVALDCSAELVQPRHEPDPGRARAGRTIC